MDNFTTVFEVTRQIDEELITLIFGGGIAIIIGTLFLILRKRYKDWHISFFKSLLAVIIGSLMSLGGLVLLVDSLITEKMLISDYNNGRYRILEGEVHVLYTQPRGGHTKGDIIMINEQEFEINYFVKTPAYSMTIAHGGVLREGTYARVYHHNGKILRIDIRDPNNQ